MENVNVYDDDIQIVDSYKIFKSDFNNVLDLIQKENPEHVVFKNRSRFSLLMEWATHNACYDYNICRESTKDVDLEYPLAWYISFAYIVAGMFSWLITQ